MSDLTFTLHFAWWWIPAAVTLCAFGWWFRIAHKDFSDGGMFAGLGALAAAVPALLVTAFAWAIAGIAK
jgi:hypothetical protein